MIALSSVYWPPRPVILIEYGSLAFTKSESVTLIVFELALVCVYELGVMFEPEFGIITTVSSEVKFVPVKTIFVAPPVFLSMTETSILYMVGAVA